MIVDAFLYDGEQEMLEARLDALAGLDAVHVAVVANRTHQGDPIDPTVLVKGRANVVQHVVDMARFDDRGRGGVGTPDYQTRERFHRNAIAAACERVHASDGDLVLMGDLDEIPDPEVVRYLSGSQGAGYVVLEQRMHAYALDWLHPQTWLGTIVTRLGPFGKWDTSPQRMRDDRGQIRQIENGGWHLTWMGGVEACERKRARFSHAEHLMVDDYGFADFRERGIDVNGAIMRRCFTKGVADLHGWPAGMGRRIGANPGYWRLP